MLSSIVDNGDMLREINVKIGVERIDIQEGVSWS